MAVNTAGISTVGARLGYAVETTAGTKPTAFKWLERCNNIGGVSLDVEQLDASALEDEITRYIQGRQDTGGTWTCTFNISDEVITQLQTMISDYTSIADNKRMWFEVWSPYLTKGFYVVAQPQKDIPIPEIGQNAMQTIDINLTIEEYIGLEDAIKPEELGN